MVAPYHEDTVCFTGDIADRLRRCGVIRPGVYSLGAARRLRHVMQMARDPSCEAQILANMELERILFDLYTEQRVSGAEQADDRIQRLIVAFKQDLRRWWTIEEMADFCDLGRDQFRRVFKKQTGENPNTYLDRLRFAKISELLVSTPLTQVALAARFGYSDPYHFSRRFKELYGIAPASYRRQFPRQ